MGRPNRYGLEAATTLKVLWEPNDCAGGRRLQRFMPVLVEALEHHGELILQPSVKEQVCAMSPATIDQMLRPHRHLGLRGCVTNWFRWVEAA